MLGTKLGGGNSRWKFRESPARSLPALRSHLRGHPTCCCCWKHDPGPLAAFPQHGQHLQVPPSSIPPAPRAGITGGFLFSQGVGCPTQAAMTFGALPGPRSRPRQPRGQCRRAMDPTSLEASWDETRPCASGSGFTLEAYKQVWAAHVRSGPAAVGLPLPQSSSLTAPS